MRCARTVLERNYGPYPRGSQSGPNRTSATPPNGCAGWPAIRPQAARLGLAGQATIEARFAPAVIGGRYRQRLEAISTF